MIEITKARKVTFMKAGNSLVEVVQIIRENKRRREERREKV